MNDTLMDQCRREAEERYPMPVFESGNYVHTTDVAIAHAVVSARQESHAAALYAERSKRPPTVQGPPMITVEEATDIALKMNRILAFGRTEASNRAVYEMLALHGIFLAQHTDTPDNG